MTNDQLKDLENKLWDSANAMRAYGGIKAADYAVPVLGLIFLRFAENKYSGFEPQIRAEYEQHQGTRMERSIEAIALATCGFYLPDYARYDFLLALPEEESMANALRTAMEGIEEYQDEKFKNVLPKEAFFEIEKKKADILPNLLKTFSDIPKDATGDVFGKIYEYFLGEFAMSEGQKGGEFFTPTSIVRFIVEVIEPFAGKIFDPACGSGGMFVQSAKFIQEANHDLNDIYVYGQEYMGETARLAKMNLMVNNIRGEITETNSYDSDPYKSLGKFDFVMANPPFNVKSVKESTVSGDERFYHYGLPKNKGKNTDDSITDANYLWVSLFATSLNKTGRAGFVMPNSASDAGNSEYEIRKKIVDSGIVDCMVSMPSNMFFTVTLPATLWFFDKQKAATDRKDKILFLDARNTYYQIDRAHREWTEEQIQNLAAIVRLYRGETPWYIDLLARYANNASDCLVALPEVFDALHSKMQSAVKNMKHYATSSITRRKAEEQRLLLESGLLGRIHDLPVPVLDFPVLNWTTLAQDFGTDTVATNDNLRAFAGKLAQVIASLKAFDVQLKTCIDSLTELWAEADKLLKLKADKTWAELALNNLAKSLDELYQNYKTATDRVAYWYSNMDWLQSRFPDAVYTDVVGLCKAAHKTEYADEQDYSLNAGRYVGVVIDEVGMTKDEFEVEIKKLNSELNTLNASAADLEKLINQNILNLFENE